MDDEELSVMTCPICEIEVPRDQIRQCPWTQGNQESHLFCQACFDALQLPKRCPTCRQNLEISIEKQYDKNMSDPSKLAWLKANYHKVRNNWDFNIEMAAGQLSLVLADSKNPEFFKWVVAKEITEYHHDTFDWIIDLATYGLEPSTVSWLFNDNRFTAFLARVESLLPRAIESGRIALQQSVIDWYQAHPEVPRPKPYNVFKAGVNMASYRGLCQRILNPLGIVLRGWDVSGVMSSAVIPSFPFLTELMEDFPYEVWSSVTKPGRLTMELAEFLKNHRKSGMSISLDPYNMNFNVICRTHLSESIVVQVVSINSWEVHSSPFGDIDDILSASQLDEKNKGQVCDLVYREDRDPSRQIHRAVPLGISHTERFIVTIDKATKAHRLYVSPHPIGRLKLETYIKEKCYPLDISHGLFVPNAQVYFFKPK